MKHITFTALEYDELSPEAKDKALARFIELHVANVPIEQWEPDHRAVAEQMERMQTPWFLGDELYHKHRPRFEAILREQEFLFHADGGMVAFTEDLVVTDTPQFTFKPRHHGRHHPLDIVCEVAVELNPGDGPGTNTDYAEVRLGFKKPDGTLVADVFAGLSEDKHSGEMEVRVLTSVDGNPDEHKIAVYPERAASEQPVDQDWA
jgi:hypothetical protein